MLDSDRTQRRELEVAVKYAVVTLLLAASLMPAQAVRWTHTYDGPAGIWDQAWRVRCGPDSGIYVCGDGQAGSLPLTFEMTALGLTSGGDRRWTYRYTGPGSRLGQAYDLAVDNDRNITVAGTTFDIFTANDFAVLGISDSGTLRWSYRVADSGVGIARAVACDQSGNAYVCGTTEDYGALTVASIAPDGTERWLRSSDWPGEALAITVDTNGTAYAVGYLCYTDTTQNFAVCRFSPTNSSYGALPGNSRDSGVAVTVGTDGWVYMAGHMDRGATGADIVVTRYDTAFTRRGWTYFYDRAGQMDQARALLYGPDGNTYVAGFSVLSDSGSVAFTVFSLDNRGQLRWAYEDTGAHAAAFNIASGLASDEAGNIYACGMLAGSESTRIDAAVVSLSSDGALRWKYLYARPDTGMDNLGSIARGPDGHLYACGTTGDPPNSDWLVVSLTTTGAVREAHTGRPESRLSVSTFLGDVIRVRSSAPSDELMEASLFDASGRVVLTASLRPALGQIELRDGRLSRLGAGVYLLRLNSGNGSAQFKLVKP